MGEQGAGLLVAPVVLVLDALALGVLHADLRGVTGGNLSIADDAVKRRAHFGALELLATAPGAPLDPALAAELVRIAETAGEPDR